MFQHNSMIPNTNNLQHTPQQTRFHLSARLGRERSISAVHSLDDARQERVPQQIVERVEVPDVELVVERATEAHSDKVACEHCEDDI